MISTLISLTTTKRGASSIDFQATRLITFGPLDPTHREHPAAAWVRIHGEESSVFVLESVEEIRTRYEAARALDVGSLTLRLRALEERCDLLADARAPRTVTVQEAAAIQCPACQGFGVCPQNIFAAKAGHCLGCFGTGIVHPLARGEDPIRVAAAVMDESPRPRGPSDALVEEVG